MIAKKERSITETSGAFVAGMGLPGCGKSTLFRSLHSLIKQSGVGTSVYLEPEEADWSDAVHNRSACGNITALTWFRADRVPKLYKAALEKKPGHISLIDSYYDKLISRYLDHPSFSWLMPPDDPYWEAYKQLANLDFELLPNADCVIGIYIEEQVWRDRLATRGRDLDQAANIPETHPGQAPMLEAARNFCAETGAIYVEFDNSNESQSAAVIELYDLLVSHNLLPERAG